MAPLIGLIETYGVGTVLIVALIVIGFLIGVIIKVQKWFKGLDSYKKEYEQRGVAAERERKNIEEMDTHITTLDGRVDRVEQSMDILLTSDKLDIKAYITEQYHYYMPKGYIDEEVMDLLEQRFDVYKKEGGNGFAERMMKELRELPFVKKEE